MGEVFLAEHIKLGRREALKILRASLAADAQFVARFRREARAVNRLRHPNIIAIYDFGQLPDGRFYLAMEYADGESVHRLLKRDDHFSVPRALGVLGQLAYAVHHAHSRGVLHRDLKPDNLILVGPDETLKVLDFGIAKIVSMDAPESVALSTGDMVWGSPRYMSPERVRGVGKDPRSDIYSIGCLAFELLLGAPPFLGTSDEIIRAHLTEDPDPPSKWRPSLNIPPELDAVIVKCLQKDPGERYQNAAELFAALTKVPGYPAAKAEGRRRFVPVPRRPDTLAPETYRNVRGALRGAAERLVDLGENDARLVTGIAKLRDQEQQLAAIEAAQDAVEHEATALRDTGGDREQSLRFALGELQLEAKKPDRPADIAMQIRDLEERLDVALAVSRQLAEAEAAIAKTAEQRAQALAQLKATYNDLEAVVNELSGQHGDDAPLTERLTVLRQKPTE
ncbi:MAG: protein kinase [Deltaproteobacteria bacterium]|nr:protein kinase [Deltaproteobacteria bacterium]